MAIDPEKKKKAASITDVPAEVGQDISKPSDLNPLQPKKYGPPPKYDYATLPPSGTRTPAPGNQAGIMTPSPAGQNPAVPIYAPATEPEFFNGQPQTESGAFWRQLGRASDYRAGEPNPPGFYGGAGGNMPSTDGPASPATVGVANAAPTAGSTAEGDRLIALGNPAHALRPAGTLSGTGIAGQPAPSGFRTIRRPGETPMLTNVNDPFDPARAAQGAFIRDDQTGATLGVPAGIAAQPQGGQSQDAYTPWFMKDNANGADSGQTVDVRTLNPAGSPTMYGSEKAQVPNMAIGRASRLKGIYERLLAQGIQPGEAARQAELQDMGQNRGEADRITAAYQQNQDRANAKSITADKTASVDANLKGAQADAYSASAFKDRYQSTDAYLKATASDKTSEQQVKFAEKIASYRQAMTLEIFKGTAERVDLTVDQRMQLAGDLAEQETMKMLAANDVAFNGSKQETPQRKQAFNAYQATLENIKARKANGQISEEDETAEYNKATEVYYRIRDQKKPS
jgi:hypothetical protein